MSAVFVISLNTPVPAYYVSRTALCCSDTIEAETLSTPFIKLSTCINWNVSPQESQTDSITPELREVACLECIAPVVVRCFKPGGLVIGAFIAV